MREDDMRSRLVRLENPFLDFLRSGYLSALERRLRGLGPGEVMVVVVVDLWDFARFNYEHTHAVGDQVLAALEQRLADSAGRDWVARIGGEEFCVTKVCLDGASAERWVHELAVLTGESFLISGEELHVAASWGVALAGSGCAVRPHLVARAEAARIRERVGWGADGPAGGSLGWYDASLDGELAEQLDRDLRQRLKPPGT